MAKPGRVYWKGTLRLSLVTIGVEIYPAVETASEISFNQIHKPSGKRVRYERTVPGVGKVENADIVKGYEVEPEVYVLLEPEEIEAIRLESKRTIDLVQCVDRSEIDPRFFERPYYVLPADDQAAEGYAIIREALRESRKVAVGQVTMAGREHLVVVGPVGKGLVLNIIRYGNELRPAATYFDEIPEHKLEPDMMDMAVQLISRKSAPFNPDAFKDSYGVALRELVEEKAKGHTILSPSSSEPASNVINLKDALKRSVQEERIEPPKSGKPAPKKPSARKPAGGSKGRAKA
jgi:DNA end-binding protein Ku